MAGVSLNDRHLELQVYKNRVVIAAVFCLLAVLILIIRLLILQIVNHDVFSTLSQSNRLRLMAIAPNRGLIYDRNGVVLAENRPSYRLELVPEEVKDINGTLERLRHLIKIEDSDIERFRKERKRGRPFEGVPLRFNLSEEEVAQFAVNRHRFPGVDIVAGLSRYYPFGAMTAPVLGYVSRIDEDDLDTLDEGNYQATTHIGKVGVEQYYEKLLHGTVGYKQVEVNVEGRVINEIKENERQPVPGEDLHLSIDIRLQTVAAAALGENSGAVVAIEPSTGAVLVLLSKPSYDPALFVNGISNEAFAALQADPARPLFNRALHGQYPPGSTIKPLFGLAALERGVINENFAIGCSGSYQLPHDKRRYRDWKKYGHGPAVDLEQAVIESCDVFFYDLAYRTGIDAMSDYVRQFGFGQPTGIDILGEKIGLFPNSEWKQKRFGEKWYTGESLSVGIGQGYTVATPLQLAYMTAIMASNGQAYRPHVLEATSLPPSQIELLQAPERTAAAEPTAVAGAEAGQAAARPETAIDAPPGSQLHKIPPALQRSVPVVAQRHWDYIRKAMMGVAHDPKGTARGSFQTAPYHAAGKTGTAQVISVKQNEEYDEEKIAKQYRDHALFIAYAPAEKPEIAMAILVENGGHGSSAAAPIARKIMDQYLIARIH
ncbi:MAG TPA: penicillin-binding protein 2 [Gammaproteobacteria bacterium]|nr:penicillin-binding protein 2 [Gammaproteobacteria bacterium]